jgi:hypothetical protein
MVCQSVGASSGRSKWSTSVGESAAVIPSKVKGASGGLSLFCATSAEKRASQ